MSCIDSRKKRKKRQNICIEEGHCNDTGSQPHAGAHTPSCLAQRRPGAMSSPRQWLGSIQATVFHWMEFVSSPNTKLGRFLEIVGIPPHRRGDSEERCGGGGGGGATAAVSWNRPMHLNHRRASAAHGIAHHRTRSFRRGDVTDPCASWTYTAMQPWSKSSGGLPRNTRSTPVGSLETPCTPNRSFVVPIFAAKRKNVGG